MVRARNTLQALDMLFPILSQVAGDTMLLLRNCRKPWGLLPALVYTQKGYLNLPRLEMKRTQGQKRREATE